MANQLAFASVAPYTGSALVSATANTAWSSPGSTGQATIFTASANGAKIDQLDVVMLNTGVSGFLLIWRWVGGTCTTYELVDCIAVATTMAQGGVYSFTYANLQLNPSDALTVTSTVASQPAQVNAYGGCY